MQAETHGHLVVLDGVFQALVLAIVSNVLELVHPRQNFEEGENGHVCYVSVFRRELDILELALRFELLRVGELPDDKEAVTKVLIGRASVLSHRCVRDLSNLVNESDHIFLKHFRADGEFMDEAETKNSVGLLTSYHGIQITA